MEYLVAEENRGFPVKTGVLSSQNKSLMLPLPSVLEPYTGIPSLLNIFSRDHPPPESLHAKGTSSKPGLEKNP